MKDTLSLVSKNYMNYLPLLLVWVYFQKSYSNYIKFEVISSRVIDNISIPIGHL